MIENPNRTTDGVEQHLVPDAETENISQEYVSTEDIRTDDVSKEDVSKQDISDGTEASKAEAQTRNPPLTYKGLVAAFLIGLFIILATTCVMGGPFEGPQVVSENFVTSQRVMKNIKGSGRNLTDLLGMRDHWVYFESSEPIVLKNQETYQPIEPKELKWKAGSFKIYTPEIDALSDLANLSGFEHKKGFYPIRDEKYLLVNKRTHEYFFSDRHIESDGF